MKTKTLTPKQRVLKVRPDAKCEWVPGWGLYSVYFGAATAATGFSAPEAWRNAAATLK